MSKDTLHDRYCRALETFNYRRDLTARSSKYTVYISNKGWRFYIGASGGVRTGDTIAKSTPVSETYKKMLLATEASMNPNPQHDSGLSSDTLLSSLFPRG